MPTPTAWCSFATVARMADGSLLAKVLTVSDGVVHGTREDRSGAALVEQLTAAGFEVVAHEVTADGDDNVASALRRLTAGFSGLVVTTGGTGFAPRDQTPEGTRQVIEREAPGLAEAMRLVSPLGRLSRGIAGITGQAIICNTPGSPNGLRRATRSDPRHRPPRAAPPRRRADVALTGARPATCRGRHAAGVSGGGPCSAASSTGVPQLVDLRRRPALEGGAEGAVHPAGDEELLDRCDRIVALDDELAASCPVARWGVLDEDPEVRSWPYRRRERVVDRGRSPCIVGRRGDRVRGRGGARRCRRIRRTRGSTVGG